MSVRTARLGDIADDLRSGFACGIDDPNGTIQFRMNNIERDGTLNWTKIRRVPMKKVKEELTLKSGDILLNVTNSPDLVGKTALFKGADEAMTFSNHFLRLRTRVDWAEPAYVARWLRRQFELGCFKAMCRSWVNQASVTRDQISNLEIPLPPLDEQRRIAAILDKADSLRQKRKQAIALLDSLTQSIFLEMFGDQKHKTRKLSALVELINGDRSSKYPSGDDIQTSGIPFLSTKNIRNSKLDLEKCDFITKAKFESLSRGKLKRGDIIITLRGTLGSAAIFDTCFETGFINAQMMIIRVGNEITPRYLLDYITNQKTRKELLRTQSGSAVRQLTARQVGELEIPVPTRSDQQRYTDNVDAIRAYGTKLLRQLAIFEEFFTSLQHRAFTGEL
ncbi:restriction endonuclease subunit S [Stappia indica]|uniref:restriction endonuclease subunit S n=1 Tax=Stappia indica TaxID=538381 RepID=UPI001CD44826|nr:restriction endonuclease subunit S [Stappia indica]MCA1298067.1 restriction endonuclease subunit S [Stappia indica]